MDKDDDCILTVIGVTRWTQNAKLTLRFLECIYSDRKRLRLTLVKDKPKKVS